MTTGIYLLTFSKEYTYIGLSLNCEARFRQHVNNLVLGKHKNHLVQEAYSIFGVPQTKIIIECDEKELKEYEIEAFDIFKPSLNIAPPGGLFPTFKGDSNSNSKYSNQTLIDAIIYVSKNLEEPLKDISKKLNLHYSTLKNICNGQGHKWLAEAVPKEYTEVLGHKGKREYNTAKYKNFKYPILVSPSGEEYIINNATSFAKEHNLNQGALAQLLLRRYRQHKGWTIK